MTFRLRYQHHDLQLHPGVFTIGRSASCHLSLDDPLVSRNHAQLSVDKHVLIEDLGSRNGVRVNGERVSGSKEIGHGDRIQIGKQEMVLVVIQLKTADTLIRRESARARAIAVVGGLADKALALKRGEEAERILSSQLGHLLQDASSGEELEDDVLTSAASYAVKLASVTQQGRWVDYVFRLHRAQGRPCSPAIVDALYEVVRRARNVDLAELRAYVQILKERLDELSPTERFVLGRLEGLERLLAAG